MSKTETLFRATGKRKTSVAQVRLNLEGSEGSFSINGKTLDSFFGNHPWQKALALKPVNLAKLKPQVSVFVEGGGVAGQAGAIAHGIARALAKVDLKLKKLMRDNGLLTRDSRIVERKKPGQPKAHKRFQFSKR